MNGLSQSERAPVAVVIPTYARGVRVLETLRKIADCSPQPAEIWIHVDCSDGTIETKILAEFPEVKILSSTIRLGPGGGRHRLLTACQSPYAASFDDDSFPVDVDFFAKTAELFACHPRAAVLGAAIWHPHQPERPRTNRCATVSSYTGCGHAIRLAAYKEMRGYLPRPVPYGLEETDLALQLFAKRWEIIDSDELRVFHDTGLEHHATAEIVSGTVANVALYAFLNYPLRAWPYALLQLGNTVAFSLRHQRRRGIISGLLQGPAFDCWHAVYRAPVTYSVPWNISERRATAIPR